MYAVRQILASPNPVDFRGQAGATLYNVRMAKASGETAPCREGLPPWKRGVSPYGLMAVDDKGARASDAPHVFARGMTPYNPDLPAGLWQQPWERQFIQVLVEDWKAAAPDMGFSRPSI